MEASEGNFVFRMMPVDVDVRNQITNRRRAAVRRINER
jgi:hypothetical protein